MRNLLDPRNNELIPTDGDDVVQIPELSPDYVEPEARPERTPAAELREIYDGLITTTKDPCAFDDNLSLRRPLSGEGGLELYRGPAVIRDPAALSADERALIIRYLTM